MTNAFDSLLDKAKEIRDAFREGENTAERVGSMFVELLTAAAEALYGADGADTLLRKLSAKGFLIPGDKLAVEHKGTSATITIPTVSADGTPGTASAVIGAVGKKAGLMLPAHVGKIESVAESLARLPVLAYDGTVGADVSVEAGAPGRVLVTAAIAAGGLSVVFQPSSGRFLLCLSVGGETRYFASWVEAEDGAGNIVARAASEYSAGRLFSNSADGRRLYLLRQGDDGLALLNRIDDDGWIDDLRARIDDLAEALEDLPVVDFLSVEDGIVLVSEWPGEISVPGTSFGVVYNPNLRLFLLKVVPIPGSGVSYYSSWDEVRGASGNVLARPSSDYQRAPEPGAALEPLAGRLFQLRENGSDPARLYAWDGGLLRLVNNFAGKITSILASVSDLASQVDGHTNHLWRVDERLGEIEDDVSGLPRSSGFIQGLLSGSFPAYLASDATFVSVLASAPRFIDTMAAGLVSHLGFNNNLASSSNFLAALSVSLSAHSGFIGALSQSNVLAHDLGETMATGSGLPLRLAANPSFTAALAANSGFVDNLSRNIASSTGFVSPFIIALTGNASAMATLKSALGL